MNLAIFADLHGRVLPAFLAVALWERDTGKKIDLILQCGDVGIFPDLDKLDRPTAKRSLVDRSEIGWHDYFVKPHPLAERILGLTEAEMICVRGNHEDHDFLDQLEAEAEGPAFPVDCYGRVKMLRTGELFFFEKENQALNILGIGRLGHPAGLTKWDNKIYLQDYEMDKLRRLGKKKIDILLAHDVPQDHLRLGWGLEESRWVIQKYRPSYHFFGHAGDHHFHTDENLYTVRGRLNDFTWENPGRDPVIAQNSMAILTWNGSTDHRLEVINPAILKQFASHSWQYLIPQK